MKERKRSYLCLAIGTLILFVVIFSKPINNVEAASESGWFLENGNWAYFNKGIKVRDSWRKDSAGWCYLGSNGYIVKDAWVTDSTGLCYLDNSGYWATTSGWKYNTAAKDWAYIGNNGYALTNVWEQDSVGWVYIGADGYWQKGGTAPDSNGLAIISVNGYWNGEYVSEAIEETTLGFGSSFIYDSYTAKMKVNIGDYYSFNTIENRFSNYDGDVVIRIPVTVENISNKTGYLNQFHIGAYNSLGNSTSLSIKAYFDDGMKIYESMRPGAKATGAIYILYSGNGDYYLTIDYLSPELVEIKLPISL